MQAFNSVVALRKEKGMVTTQQPPALQLPQSSPPLLDQEHHHHLHLLHLHFLASETAVLISSNSPNYLGLQVSVSSVKTKQENADNHTHSMIAF